MQAGLIFYQAHRTFENKITAERFLSSAGCPLADTRAVPDSRGLFGALSTLLHTCDLVLVVSAAAGGLYGENEPLASAQLFGRLGVETGPGGSAPARGCGLRGPAGKRRKRSLCPAG